MLTTLFLVQPRSCILSTNPNDSLRITNHRAAIIFDDGWQDLVLELRYTGATGNLVWIVAVPSSPEIVPQESMTFKRLGFNAGYHRYRNSDRQPQVSHDNALILCDRPRDEVSDYEVIPSVESARERLLELGCRWEDTLEEVLTEYESGGWSFVILQIDQGDRPPEEEARSDTGTIRPVLFRFKVEEPVDPIKMTRILPGEIEHELYLFAADQLEPIAETDDAIFYSTAGPFGLPGYVRSDPNGGTGSWHDLRQKSPTLLKYWFRKGASEAEDMYFRPYDPFSDLHSEDWKRRGEAATHIGRAKLHGGSDSLALFLSERTGKLHKDVFSALWALGECGGDAAESTLQEWVNHDRWLCRIEARESLMRLGSIRAVPEMIDCFGETEDLDILRMYDATTERTACFENAIILCDSSCIPDLREIARRESGWSAWQDDRFIPDNFNWRLCSRRNVGGIIAGARAVAALVALGDEMSMEVIRQSILSKSTGGVEDSVSMQADLVAQETKKLVMRGGSPRRGRVLPAVESQWGSLEVAHTLFEQRPDSRDQLYQELVKDPGLSHYEQALVLSRLSELREGNLSRIEKLVESALQDPDVRVMAAMGREEEAVNLKLLAVAETYGFQSRIDELIDLYHRVPAEESVVCKYILDALYNPSSPKHIAYAENYIRTEWQKLAAHPDYEQRLVSHEGREFPPPGDLEIGKSLARTVRYARPYPSHVISMIADQNLHPYLRLFWISNVYGSLTDRDALVRPVTQCLSELEAEIGQNPVLAILYGRVSAIVEEAWEKRRERESKYEPCR